MILRILNKPVVVIGATSRPEYMDTTLRRAGRFDREITLKIPDEKGRLEILQSITRTMKILDKNSFMKELSRLTPGYVPADLFTLCKEASINAISRIYEQFFFNEANKTEIEHDINNREENLINQAKGMEDNKEENGELVQNDNKEEIEEESKEIDTLNNNI